MFELWIFKMWITNYFILKKPSFLTKVFFEFYCIRAKRQLINTKQIIIVSQSILTRA